MKKLYIFIVCLLPVLAQAQIAWNFTGGASPSSTLPANFSAVSDLGRSNNFFSAANPANPPLINGSSATGTYPGASQGNNAGAAVRIGALVTDTTGSLGSACFTFTLTPAPGSAITLSQIVFGSRSTGTGPTTYDIRTNLDNYAATVATATLNPSGSGNWALLSSPALTLTGASDQAVTVRIYGYGGSGSASAGTANWRIDDLAVTATASASTAPTILAPGALTGFTTVAGTASASQPATISGSNLTGDITISITGGDYQVSLTDNDPDFGTSVTLPQSGGVAGGTIHVRIAAAAPAGAANGTLSLTAPGAATKIITLGGTVNPTITVDPLPSFTATAASSTEIDLAGTGNAAGNNIVVAYTTAGPGNFGTPAGTYIAGNAITGGGTVLYSGPSAGFSFSHTGLTPATTYYYSAWSADGSNNYSTPSLSQATTNAPPAAHVVINQVYGGGGNANSFYKNDFIELYNDDPTPVDLSGWSVQYSSAGGSGNWQVTALHGIIPAHAFFLIQESAGTTSGGGTAPLPTPDITGTLALGATSGKVLLSNSIVAQSGDNPSGATVMDKVGYGDAATGFETQAATAPAGNTTSEQRKVDGADGDNNFIDFTLAAPIPRNSTYTTSQPAPTTLIPPDGRLDVPSALAPSVIFDKPLLKGSGNITITAGGVPTVIDVNSPDIVVTNTRVTINTPLTNATSYSITVDAGAFVDVYGNNSVAITHWLFTTYDRTAATVPPVSYTFNTCSGNGLLPGGFTQYSVLGAQIWDCTSFGKDSISPTNAVIHTNGVQMNGFANNIDNANEDWLISPKLNLTGTSFPLLSFWSLNEFAGDPLQLKVSTDYSGTGDPNAATWTDVNGKFPSQGSEVWTFSPNINLSAFKQGSVYFAFVYRSTTQDGSRWTLDSISVDNSLAPPPPSLTLSTNNLQFGYSPSGTDSTKTLVVTGNDITGDITLTATGDFTVSTDSVSFGSTATLLQADANNVAKKVFVRFHPVTANNQFSETLSVAISDTTAVVTLKGNSVDPTSTLNVVNWNLNWFGIADPTFGPVNKALQEQNVGIILPSLHADLYALQEVVNEPALAAIVATMPGYAYVVGQFGSHSNPTEANHYPLDQIQKLGFVYNTAKFTNVRVDSLLSLFGTEQAADTATTYYNDWSSGRYPYMLTADVQLSDNNGGAPITRTIRFINIHGKSNLDPVVTSYNRRRHGALILDSLIQARYHDDNVIILGDYNDDLNQTITAGIASGESSYAPFTITDVSRYIFPTKPLSPAGQHSDVNFTSVIDNVIASISMTPYYFPGSASVLSDVSGLVNKYGTTTTDHYPVFTQFSFSGGTPLPVKLFDFTADKQDEGVKLSWTTSEETNSKLFEVQRSSDGGHFTVIGTVAAKGNSNTPSNYSFTDQQPFNGANYYRLNEVDLDGKGDYSKVLRVDFSRQATIRIIPNPAHTTMTLSLGNAREALDISILDGSGRVMKQLITTPGTQDIPMDVSGFARGLYMVKVVSSAGSTTQKLLIQ